MKEREREMEGTGIVDITVHQIDRHYRERHPANRLIVLLLIISLSLSLIVSLLPSFSLRVRGIVSLHQLPAVPSPQLRVCLLWRRHPSHVGGVDAPRGGPHRCESHGHCLGGRHATGIQACGVNERLG